MSNNRDKQTSKSRAHAAGGGTQITRWKLNGCARQCHKHKEPLQQHASVIMRAQCPAMTILHQAPPTRQRCNEEQEQALGRQVPSASSQAKWVSTTFLGFHAGFSKTAQGQVAHRVTDWLAPMSS